MALLDPNLVASLARLGLLLHYLPVVLVVAPVGSLVFILWSSLTRAETRRRFR